MAERERSLQHAGTPSRLDELRRYFDIEGKQAAVTALEAQMAAPEFWNDAERARRGVQQVKALKIWLDPFRKLRARVRSARELE